MPEMAPLHHSSGQVAQPSAEQRCTFTGILYILFVVGKGFSCMSGGRAFLVTFLAMLGWFILQTVACLEFMVVSLGSFLSLSLCFSRCAFNGGLLSSWRVFRNTWSCLQVWMGVWFLAFAIIRFIVVKGYPLFRKCVVIFEKEICCCSVSEVFLSILRASPYMTEFLVDFGW